MGLGYSTETRAKLKCNFNKASNCTKPQTVYIYCFTGVSNLTNITYPANLNNLNSNLDSFGAFVSNILGLLFIWFVDLDPVNNIFMQKYKCHVITKCCGVCGDKCFAFFHIAIITTAFW